jgi:hypothetical protein
MTNCRNNCRGNPLWLPSRVSASSGTDPDKDNHTVNVIRHCDEMVGFDTQII